MLRLKHPALSCLVLGLQGKTEQFLQNQQQNLSDAMSVVPRLATGIDVNVKFGR